jgi:hypothetical protein
MKRLIAKLLLGCTVLLLGGVSGSLVYLSDAINVISEPPRAPVLALPADFDPRLPVAPYIGPHPRIAGRPKETFPFPIHLGKQGPVKPLFAGPPEYPFLCGENNVTHRQPLVDNHDGYGVPVFAERDGEIVSDEIIGYSLDCSQPTAATYYYNRVGTRDFFPLESLPEDEAKNDIAKVTVNGKSVPFIVRVETGTINRFHYIIAALRGSHERLAQPTPDNWNRKLIYQFRGGVGIGKRQGKIRASDVFDRLFDQLAQGYAVAYSTGNQTSIHYNMWLAEDTAARVKRQFVGLYGEPLYTVGIGGSGGAIQQYLIAQNHPGLLDAIIPLYSYPDMITQTINIMDCEPLEYYFDVVDGKNPLWQIWENRSWIQGMSADSEARNRYSDVQSLARLLRGELPKFREGATECIKGWRGLTPLVYNPTFVHFIKGFAPAVAKQIHWTHWDNLKYFYGVNARGYANATWDNVGVQYGLNALREGRITPEDFLHLNTHLGGWKPHHQLKPEKLWLLAGNLLPVDLSFWSHHNMHHSQDGGKTPARRTEGSLAAMRAAYRSGHVFVGHVEIPILDVRHYLDKELDMHHATASFATRMRLLEGQGHADNHVIWMSHKRHDPINEAIAVMDEWMISIRDNPGQRVAANKPAAAQDKCLAADGNIIAQGEGVWDGDWNGRPPGACMAVYPRYKTSREVAGAGVTGDIFKCHLQPVAAAIDDGVFDPVDMSAYQTQLETIFPQGVCDYSLGDLARPSDLMASLEHHPVDRGGPAMIATAHVHKIDGLEINSRAR